MARTYVTDLGCFLDHGNLPDELPGPALNLVLHLGAIVAWMTSRTCVGPQRTNVVCRRSPGYRRCRSEIEAVWDVSTSTIVWQCPLCRENGYISGWQGSPWDRSQADTTFAGPPKLHVLAGGQPARTRIAEGQTVQVTFNAGERELLEAAVMDPGYLDRLQPQRGGKETSGSFTLDELEDILGCVAAEANHADNARLEEQLDALFCRLLSIQRSYDDGNWNDSGDAD